MTVSNTFNEALWASKPQKKNYILNGAMMVSQENGTTAGTTNGYYPVDQFFGFLATTGSVQFRQVSGVTPAGSPNRISVTVASPDTSISAGENVGIIQNIEGYRTADLLLGSSSARTLVLRFLVRAPAGTYCVALRNGGNSRSYVAEYTISAGEANTDVVKSVVVPGDVTGTWTTGTMVGLSVCWTLTCGSTYQTTAGSWTAGNYIASPNQSNFMGTNGSVFQLSDVGLYQGVVDPGFAVSDYLSELLKCQRYYERATFSGMFLGGGSFSQIYAPIYFVEKRASVTVGLPSTTNICWNSGGAGVTPTSLGFGVSSVKSGYVTATGSGLGGINAFNLTLNARM